MLDKSFMSIKVLFQKISVFIIVIFGTIFLIHFSSNHHPWFYDDTQMNCALGTFNYFGNYLAGVLIYFIGGAVWLLLGLTIFIIFKNCLNQLVGLVLLIFNYATQCAYFRFDCFFGIDPGGLFGSNIHLFLSKYDFIENLILFTWLLISFVLIFRFSWLIPITKIIKLIGCFKYISYIINGYLSLKNYNNKRHKKYLQSLAFQELYIENLVWEVIYYNHIEEHKLNFNIYSDPTWSQLRIYRNFSG